MGVHYITYVSSRRHGKHVVVTNRHLFTPLFTARAWATLVSTAAILVAHRLRHSRFLTKVLETAKNRVSLCLNFAENDKFRVLGGIYIVREPEYLKLF